MQVGTIKNGCIITLDTLATYEKPKLREWGYNLYPPAGRYPFIGLIVTLYMKELVKFI